MIHPTDLRRRRKRCGRVVAQLTGVERAPTYACNACGSPRKAIVAPRDRYGVSVRTAVCLECGLVYLLEPLTPEGYADFYARGSYREVSGRFSGKKRSMQQIRAGQVDYTERTFHFLEPFLPQMEGSRLLDIGASTGLVAERFQREGFSPVLLDPAVSEIHQPETHGMELVESTFEAWEPEGRFELILLCRTIEHLLDLRGSIEKIHDILKPQGIFYCDVVDFFELCRLEGPPEVVTKLDHCFWLAQETAQVFFRRLGFETLAMFTGAPYEQLGLVLRRGAADPNARLPPGWIDDRLRKLREIGSDWQAMGRSALDPVDWLRRRGSRFKRLLARP